MLKKKFHKKNILIHEKNSTNGFAKNVIRPRAKILNNDSKQCVCLKHFVEIFQA